MARWVREPGRDAERKKRKISREVFVLWWVCIAGSVYLTGRGGGRRLLLL